MEDQASRTSFVQCLCQSLWNVRSGWCQEWTVLRVECTGQQWWWWWRWWIIKSILVIVSFIFFGWRANSHLDSAQPSRYVHLLFVRWIPHSDGRSGWHRQCLCPFGCRFLLVRWYYRCRRQFHPTRTDFFGTSSTDIIPDRPPIQPSGLGLLRSAGHCDGAVFW